MTTSVPTAVIGEGVRTSVGGLDGVAQTLCSQFETSTEHFVSVQVMVSAGADTEALRPEIEAELAALNHQHSDWPVLRLEHLGVLA